MVERKKERRDREWRQSQLAEAAGLRTFVDLPKRGRRTTKEAYAAGWTAGGWLGNGWLLPRYEVRGG